MDFHDFYNVDQRICQFPNSQKLENFIVLSLLSKYIRYQDLHYFLLMLLTKNFCHSKCNIALGVRILDLEDNKSIHVS